MFCDGLIRRASSAPLRCPNMLRYALHSPSGHRQLGVMFPPVPHGRGGCLTFNCSIVMKKTYSFAVALPEQGDEPAIPSQAERVSINLILTN